MKKLTVLTGAGISAESGIPTFRGAGGLWEGHDVMDVASPEGWEKDMDLVLDFYNQRRKKALEAKPNRAHEILAELESDFEMRIVTQNVDNLHERAGSTRVLHLHGSLFESRSTIDPNLIYPIDGWQLTRGDLCGKGSQLRPNIVWFGELVPLMDKAIEWASLADIFLVVGTSLQVYPAASLIRYTLPYAKKIIIDPGRPEYFDDQAVQFIEEKAGTGMEKVRKMLLS